MSGKIILKNIVILTLLSFLGVTLYYLPYEKIAQRIGFIRKFTTNTQLSISFKNGAGQIIIDDKDYGSTPQTINDLKPGLHKLIINRIIDEENSFYKPFQVYIPIQNNTETYVNVEVAPDGFVSSYIIYYEDAPPGNKGFMIIKSSTNNVSISINGTTLSKTDKMQELDPGEYNLSITAEGYEPIEIPIIIRDGLTLVLNVNLLPIPINLSTTE